MSTRPRPKTNDGHDMRAQRVVPLRQSLIYAVVGANERQKPKERCADGMTVKRGAPAVKLSDAQVLRIRALREFTDMRPKAIAEAVGVELRDVYSTLTYHNRVHLIPKPADVLANA